MIEDPAGRIWFSLNRGISVVDPGRLKSNSALAIAHVQSISADGASIGLGQPVHIPGGHQRVTFGYAGLSLSVPERVRFRYRLDGFDHNWSEPAATREAVYTNLPPRSYRFRVIASNPDGVWSNEEEAVAFEGEPLVWQTWWFRASVVIACLMAALALYRRRLHQMTQRLNVRFEERLAERTRIAQELHDTLLQGFLSASMQVHVAADRLPPDSQIKPGLMRALSGIDAMIAIREEFPQARIVMLTTFEGYGDPTRARSRSAWIPAEEHASQRVSGRDPSGTRRKETRPAASGGASG